MNEEINAEEIKNWIKTKLTNKEFQKNSKLESYELSKITANISNLSENYNLRATPLRDVITGKTFLHKPRIMLQREVVDWTLSPFLDKQTFFNKSIIGILNALDSKQESVESALDSLDSLEESVESVLDSINSKQESVESVLDSINSKQESVESALESLDSLEESAESALNSLNSKQQSISSEFHMMKEKLSNYEVTNAKNSSQLQENISNLKKDVIHAEIRRAFQFVLQREPDKKAMDFYTNKILQNDIKTHMLYDSIRQSDEYNKLIQTQETKNTQIDIKKFNDMLKFSEEYELQIVKKNPHAICFVDIFKIAYYNELFMSERFDEYFWTLKNLNTKGKLLDVGCTESLFAQELANISSLEVYGIDIRNTEYSPTFKFSKEDCKKTKFVDSYFDQITVISSLEHFGLDFYENKIIDKDADIKSMNELYRIIKKDGALFLTLPWGEGDKSWYKKYNPQRIKKIMNNFKIKESKYLKQTHVGWKETTADEASKIGDSKIIPELPGAVVLIKAVPKNKK